MKKFRIYAWPAYSTRKINPYNYIIYKHIEEEGYPVQDFRFNSTRELLIVLFSKTAGIFHIHWPTSNILAPKNFYVALYRVILFFFLIKLIRISRKKVFWTVHNFDEHEVKFPVLQSIIHKILYKNVQGFISMNKAGMHLIENRSALTAGKKISLIHHPHYKEYYSNTMSRKEARQQLNIFNDVFVFLFAGQIRQYKNVPSLVEAFKELKRQDTLLLIAGKVFKDIDIVQLESLVKACPNVRLVDSFIEEDDMQVFMNAADLVVTPYSKVFNSGSVFLNLSFNKPTLAPAMYSISELREIVGKRWIKTYEGELNSNILKAAMLETKKEMRNGDDVKPNIDLFDPKIVARNTIEFYKSFMN